MIKSYLLKPRFSSIDISQCKFFSTSKTLVNQGKTGTWYINQFNKQYKLTIKTEIDGETIYNEKMIDEKLATKLILKSKNKTVSKRVYSVYLPHIAQKTKIEYYTGELKGLVVLTVSFNNEKEAKKFTPPSYSIREITDDDYYDFINLSKVTFKDIEKKENFNRFYKKVKPIVETC